MKSLRFLLIFLLLLQIPGSVPKNNAWLSEKHIVFNSIVKSGSSYIVETLRVGLGSSIEPIREISYEKYWKYFANIKYGISKQHDAPTNTYMKAISTYDNVKMVIHVRDPRQAILSLVHHYDRDNARKVWKIHGLPDGYYNLTWSQKIDWNIENSLPRMVKFIEAWLYAIEQEASKPYGIKFLLTTYEELITDEQKLFHKILDFYSIPRDQFKYVAIEKNDNVLYRKGDINEWRSELSAEQKARMAQIIPEGILERFGWDKY